MKKPQIIVTEKLPKRTENPIPKPKMEKFQKKNGKIIIFLVFYVLKQIPKPKYFSKPIENISFDIVIKTVFNILFSFGFEVFFFFWFFRFCM